MEKEQALDEDRLFEDQSFPCEASSLFSDYSTPIARFQNDITWHRPHEICSTPTLFPDDTNGGQAKQGLLGDCWFLCALTILLKNQHLMDKVVPPGQALWGGPGYRGSFTFSLWQHGRWTEVIVDDRLPCLGSKLCFSSCQSPTAFWVSLLEKAYAKLHGSYEHLWAGQVSEAMVDLTGGLAESWGLGDCGREEDPGQGSPDSDRRRRMDGALLQELREGCSVSCSVNSTPRGRGGQGQFCDQSGGAGQSQFHALSVVEWVDVRTVDGRAIRLFSIRNPWGRRCWDGAWREGGEGWNSLDTACTLDLLGRTHEGQFWVDQTEFLSHFDTMTVGYFINQDGHLQSIYSGGLLTYRQQMDGRWVKGQSAGGCRNNSSYSSNPKFWLRVCEKGELLVSLLQHRRCSRKLRHSTQQQPYQAIALHLWKVEKKRFNVSRAVSSPACASTHCHAYQREVVLHTHLEPGFHLLIPSTFLKGAEGEFLLRVFSSTPTSLSALKTTGPSLPLVTEGEWETNSFQGTWVAGSTAGGSRNFRSHWQNPHFLVTMGNDLSGSAGDNVRVTLHQTCPDTDTQAIGFHLYKAPEGQGAVELNIARDEEPVASCVPHCYTQDVSLACCLPPGSYIIVPSTYRPNCPGQFILTVARRTHRRVLTCQENLGTAIREVSEFKKEMESIKVFR